MKYNEQTVPNNVMVWAYAYRPPYSMLNIKPIEGKVITKSLTVCEELVHFKEFHYINKDGSRAFLPAEVLCYADTQQEAIDAYNRIILKRINQLNEKLGEVVADYIIGYNGS